jgi:ubiquinone/menaquinone biosynthesis C-methylase UbiE
MGDNWTVRDGVLDFTYPRVLAPTDAEFRQKYDDTADEYDVGLQWLFASFHEDEDRVRAAMVDRLAIKPGDRVLEVGCGTGKDSLHIVQRIVPGGELYAFELSVSMLRLARKRMSGASVPIEYILGNASYLPFADHTFDGVFHFGGINTFGEKRRALAEMARVTRLGGKVVVGDESVAPWLRRRLYGRVLRNANPLYEHQPPMALLPPTARDVSLSWILGNAFYLIDFRIGEGPPTVDMDLVIPGKRGGTLRSRWQDRNRIR